ncbi:MAG: AAA family ATPase [Candidatus Sericytochromatia bacterium]|nr:AAA family ATPase [Candidatus Sericytochromatia bacterium]
MEEDLDEIEIMIRARYPIIYIISWEEKRVEADLLKIANRTEKKIFSWTVTQGLVSMTGNKSTFLTNDSTRDLVLALENIQRAVDPAIYILKDTHHYMNDATVIRKLRDLSISLRSSFKTIIIISPILKIPSELEKDVNVIDYKLPSINDLGILMDKLILSIQNSKKNVEINLDNAGKEKLLQAAMGLTLSEAESVLSKAIVSKKRLSVEDIGIIHSEKKQIIKKSGLLEFYPTHETMSNVGGLTNLKVWLKKRSIAFTKKARNYGLPQPKGIMLLGVSGSGKSLVAKAVASLWQLPLLRLDIGSLFSGLVGSSEENMRKTIKTAESVAPCLLWLDEIDKGFSGSGSSNVSDGGTTARVLSSFLTWMQEKDSPVFIIATANDISHLPPELLRKGRFDEIFFLDLPELKERAEIFAIHLIKRGRDPKNFDLQNMAITTEGFSGSEIEELIISSMYDSFEEDRELNNDDIKNAISHSVPLSHTMKEVIDELRLWTKNRARPASG